MIPIIFLAAPAPVQTVTVTHPSPVVIYQAAPRPLFPLFAPKPQLIVVPAEKCDHSNCSK